MKDYDYLTFRLGDDSHAVNGRYGRHFYENDTKEGYRSLPLYNNSFYFYFGVNKGNTAIDKFNKQFFSQCFQNKKNPFSIVIEKQAAAICECVYVDNNAKKKNAYAWIRVILDDIQTNFNYTLYDSYGNIVISENDLDTRYTDFVIGGKVTHNDDGEDDITSNDNGYIHYQKTDESLGTKLINQTYTLSVTDVNGRTLTKRIKLEQSLISVQYSTVDLGTKAYLYKENSKQLIERQNICNEDTDFYGKIQFSTLFIDGYECQILSSSPISTTAITANEATFIVNVKGVDGAVEGLQTKVKFTVRAVEKDDDGSSLDMRNCLCKSGITSTQMPKRWPNVFVSTKNDYGQTDVDENGRTIVSINVYRPMKYSIEASVDCSDDCDNKSLDIVTVKNGQVFQTFLNTMPTRFIIGSVNDTNVPTVGDTSNFYYHDVQTEELSEHVKGWFGVYDPKAYHSDFNALTNENINTWSDYIELNEGINEQAYRRAMKYKFDTMFELSKAVYIEKTVDNTFLYTAVRRNQADSI